MAQGLSPRVRGNPFLGSKGHSISGSIPARAGEPLGGALTILILPVYPRACGGTYAGELVQNVVKGLSPRVRGNRSQSAAST